MTTTIRALRAGEGALIVAAGHLFDTPPDLATAERFLGTPGHHLLIAFEDEVAAGFVSGVELTHPDKGTEMFLYELAVEVFGPAASQRPKAAHPALRLWLGIAVTGPTRTGPACLG